MSQADLTPKQVESIGWITKQKAYVPKPGQTKAWRLECNTCRVDKMEYDPDDAIAWIHQHAGHDTLSYYQRDVRDKSKVKPWYQKLEEERNIAILAAKGGMVALFLHKSDWNRVQEICQQLQDLQLDPEVNWLCQIILQAKFEVNNE